MTVFEFFATAARTGIVATYFGSVFNGHGALFLALLGRCGGASLGFAGQAFT